MLSLVLMACSAEFLRIPRSPKGDASVHQEDLRRDIWAVEKGTSATEWWFKRIRQFDATVVHEKGFSCVLHSGEDRGITYWTSLQEEGLSVRLAALLSLVKSSDRLEREKQYTYCLGLYPLQEKSAAQEIGNVSGLALSLENGYWQTKDASVEFQSLLPDGFERLEDNIRQIIAHNSPELLIR